MDHPNTESAPTPKNVSFAETPFPYCDDYTALDIETTGLDPLRGKIIDIAAIRVRGSIPANTFHTFIRPRQKLSQTVSCLTGITNESLAGAPSITEILPDFLQFIGDDRIVAYNAGFVIRFLDENCLRSLHHSFQNTSIDIVHMGRMLFDNLPNHRMDTLAAACHVPDGGQGTEAFTRMTYGCYEYMKVSFL